MYISSDHAPFGEVCHGKAFVALLPEHPGFPKCVNKNPQEIHQLLNWGLILSSVLTYIRQG